MTWVQSTWSCQCPAVTVWNGNFCIANPCIGGKIWDNFQRECVCLAGRVFVNGLCLPPEVACSNERVWDNRLYVCVCPDGYWDNGFRCIEIPRCPDGSRRNPLNGRCEPICPPGFAWIETKNECLDPTCP